MQLRAVVSTSAAARLRAAHEFLSSRHPSEEVVIVGASRGAADDLARAIGRDAGATFGLTRFSFTELAARAAAAGGGRRASAADAGLDAVAARATFDALAGGDLTYFAPVADLPGFPRALARTVHELRLAGVERSELARGGPGGRDIAALLERVDAQLRDASVDDRAALLDAAAAACRADRVRWARLPIVLLDVPLDSRAEQNFAAALIARSGRVFATLPDGDAATLAALERLGIPVSRAADAADPDSDLSHLRRDVFGSERPAERAPSGDAVLFSAPGEGREAIEIVRRALAEASAGVPFDEMAVLLRVPAQYLGLLETACARGGVPAYFDRGTERPDPSGRAFVALLRCAVEGLSARRFDEYLSLGQVPQVHAAAEASPETVDSDEDAVVAGTLRSPWKWEELIVESSVVGGRTREAGGARWRRRLRGLANDYRLRIAELAREEPESPIIARLRRDQRNLGHLSEFALPIVDLLSAWPDEDSWGEWLDRFTALAKRSLRRPERVVQTLAAMRPMAAIRPVRLEEAADVLHERLVMLEWDPPSRRYGRLFVGTPHQARGRTFRVVFVPGLAERVVPQRPREDPLLLDELRQPVGRGLVCQDDRSAAERLLLKIAIGAATERLYLSYPRLDSAETRERVPSFYALDVVRAITGRIPDHRDLASRAAEAGGASLAWPAPANPDEAIDDLEHDLATLKPLLDARDPATVRGRAHYLLGLNASLRRSVIGRWTRERKPWSPSDGLVRVVPGIDAAIAANRLGTRPYSLSALQRFAACPYQFLLATIFRLEPWDEPEPLMRMDPLTRGSLFHEAQARFYRAMQAAAALPVAKERVAEAVALLDNVVRQVAAEYEEQLAPAIERVWRDEVSEIHRDLSIWVRRLADDPSWRPEYFEFSFGLSDDGRDPRSLPDPVKVANRFVLRGSVDLIEVDPGRGVLRITDHKTGKNRSKPDQIVGGGKVLQPVLYSMAVEQGLGRRVERARLYFATTAGGFAEAPVAIDDYSRAQALQVLEIIDRAVSDGFLVAAPDTRACTWCDFRPVCGPRAEDRAARKAQDRLADLQALRSMR